MSVAQMAAVRGALRRLVQDPSTWPAPSPQILRNLLLDACGGEARPLIALLLRAADHGIPDRLAESGDGSAWEKQRGVLTVTLVSDGFVQQEWAIWAVETWAYGLGLIRQEELRVGVAPPPAPPAQRPSPTAARTSPYRSATVSRPVLPPRWATQGPGPRRPSGPPLPPYVPFRLDSTRRKLTAALVIGALMTGVVALGARLRARRQAPVLVASPDNDAGLVPASLTAPVAARPARAGIPSITMGALPPPASAGEVRRVIPPTRAGVASDPTRYPPAYTTYTAAPLDRLRLKGGRELTGRVEVVRASTVQFRDGESGLRYEFQKTEIAEITTEFGTKVRFEPDGTPSNERGGASVTTLAGFGGSYRVRYGTAAVRGSAACGSLWRRPPGDDRLQLEHRAGADTVTLSFVGGGKFTAVLDNAGRFSSSVVIVPDQALTSSAITTRMEGQLKPGGFEGVVHILAYRRSATTGENDVACFSDIPATGERISDSLTGSGGR